MARPLGKDQIGVLGCMAGRKNPCWHEACGWTWSTLSRTRAICESLAKRGLVTVTEDFFPMAGRTSVYTINDAGRKAVEKA